MMPLLLHVTDLPALWTSPCWHETTGHSDRVPTHRESQGISLVRKVREFCWWSGNFGSLRMKTAIFVYVSGQSSYSLM